MHGVGFDRPVLEQAGIDHVDGLAAVTGNDEVNAVVARLASRIFHVPKVVARLHDPLKAEIYRRLGVQVVAPVDWSIHRTTDLLTFAQAGVVASLGSGQVDLVEVDAPCAARRPDGRRGHRARRGARRLPSAEPDARSYRRPARRSTPVTSSTSQWSERRAVGSKPYSD